MPLDCTTPECIARLALDKESARSLLVQFMAQVAAGTQPAAVGVTLAENTISVPDSASTLLLAADAVGDRRIAWIQNPTNVAMWLSHSGAATLGNGIQLSGGGVHVFGDGDWFTAQSIHAIQDSGGPLDLLVVVGTL